MATAKNGADGSTRELPTDGAGVNATGEEFRPNLAMGGGTYRMPLEVPKGPGNLAPKLDLIYNTSAALGVFGLGWTLSLPFIEAKRRRLLRVDERNDPPRFSLVGAEPLIEMSDGSFLPESAEGFQRFERVGDHFVAAGLNGLVTRFGGSAGSRIEGTAPGEAGTYRWYLDRITAPGGHVVAFAYDIQDGVAYAATISWGSFTLSFEYEPRPDPWSSFAAGFEVRTTRRCRRIELRNAAFAAGPLMRRWDLAYSEAPLTGHSLLRAVQLTGWSAAGPTIQPPLTFAYTGFARDDLSIGRMRALVSPPPELDESTTLFDLGGSGLPGVLSFTGQSARFWENRGDARWGPPRELTQLPAQVDLAGDDVQFVDITGDGTADLLLGAESAAGYFPNAPGRGFEAKRLLPSFPSFALGSPETRFIDLDGDGVHDLFTVSNGMPIGLLNDRGHGWRAPVSLEVEGPVPLALTDARLRFADMNADGGSDLVLLEGDAARVWPYLGQGRWGAARLMRIPDGLEPREDVLSRTYLVDTVGNGCADLVELGADRVRIWINRTGEDFAPPIVLERMPQLFGAQVVVADILGTGVASLVWARQHGNRHEYWHLSTVGHQKPYLLSSIDNGRGLTTRIRYSTSTAERTRDRDAGVPWATYLPFVVHVVREVENEDVVRGIVQRQRFAFHDGHYDAQARRWLGFGRVDVDHDGDVWQGALSRIEYFHNRPEQEPWSRGQPYRIEHHDAPTGERLKTEHYGWQGLVHAGVREDAHVILKVLERIELHHAGAVASGDETTWQHDELGRIVRQVHRNRYVDLAGAPQEDVNTTETSYAARADGTATSLAAERILTDASGALVELERRFYDGPPFTGAPLGEADNGWLTRVQVAVLTGEQLDAVYGGALPNWPELAYTELLHPRFGRLLLVDKERVEHDAAGNVFRRRNARGATVEIQYDAEGLWPVRVTQATGAVQELEYDPVAAQVAREVSFNGHETRIVYDGLGEILEIYRPGAVAGRPTEAYERDMTAIPNRVTKRVRIDHDDPIATWVQHEYFDGHQQRNQVRTATERGDWAVGRHKRLNGRHAVVEQIDGWFDASGAWDPAVPVAIARARIAYDAIGRTVREELPNGGANLHVYRGNVELFFGPNESAALANDPAAPPLRVLTRDAWQHVVEVQENPGLPPMRLAFDAKDRQVRCTNPLGHTVVALTFDLRGGRIREVSADAGMLTRVRDLGDNEILVTDSRGRSVYRRFDDLGRLLEVRHDGPAGPLQEQLVYDAGAGANLVGRLASASGAFGTAEYSYTPSGQRASVTRTFTGFDDPLEVRFTYNAQDKITSTRYPAGELRVYGYNAAGLLTSVSGLIDHIEYDPTGLRTAVDYASGVSTEIALTPGLGLIDRIETFHRTSGERYQHLVHHYDLAGRLQSIQDLSTVAGKVRNNQAFTYDARDRLASATGQGPGAAYFFQYEYDTLGNMTRNDESFTDLLRYGHQEGDVASPNRLVRTAGSPNPEWEYDAAGNMTRSPEQGTLTYDHRGRLVALEKDGDRTEHVYDHEGTVVITRSTSVGMDYAECHIEGLYRQRNDGTSLTVYWDGTRKIGERESGTDGLIFHVDRLGNNNVWSALVTGAFAGHAEYTPYGRLDLLIRIDPHFGFQQACHSRAWGLVHLQTRFYAPALGRFLTADRYLLERVAEIPPMTVAWNLYVYGGGNPVNYADPTGRFLFVLVAAAYALAYVLTILLVAAVVVGIIAGIVGAAVNGAETWDEWLLSIVAGVVGALGVTLLGFALGGPVAAAVLLGLFAVFSIIGTPIAKALDDSNSKVAWGFSFVIKLFNSPLLTIIGLFVALGYAAAGHDVELRRGTLFVNVGGTGRNGTTLGAVSYVQGGHWSGGSVNDDLARHEAYHSRQALAFGEIGFYLTYIIVGTIWGSAEAGEAFATDASGCGNPFEKTARTFNHPAPATPTGKC